MRMSSGLDKFETWVDAQKAAGYMKVLAQQNELTRVVDIEILSELVK